MAAHRTTLFSKRLRAALAIAFAPALAALMINSAAAQDPAANYPNRAIRILVPFAAGGGNDILARLIGQKMSENFGQPVVIENKPGASGELATEYVKNAAPDGYTLLVAANGSMAVSAAINSKLGYSPLRDFSHIGLVASFPLVLLVNNALPIRNVAELVAYAKANPDKANYAEPSVAFQIVMENLKLKTGAPLQLIPYKSSMEAATAVITGATIATLVDAGPVAGLIKNGQVRAIAITAASRAPEFPDVPTMAESGFPDMSISFWTGLFAPASVPPPIIKKLEGELLRIVKLPDIQQRMKSIAVVPEGRSGEDTRRFIEGQIARFAEIARAANLIKN
jgi:tripartite-type tricarboxylate transporter receptor subunit TctC